MTSKLVPPLSERELALAAGLGSTRAAPRLDALLAALNEPQRAVATRGAGPLLVVAGPGAGKTRAIVARVAHLLLVRGARPEQIVAITFSRRAAAELQGRLDALLRPVDEAAAEVVTSRPAAPAERGVWAGTFHALGAAILRRGGAAHFGRPPNYTIFDQDDVERTLRRICGALGTPAPGMGRLVTAARRALSLCKRAGSPFQGMVGEGDGALPLDEVGRRYEDELRDAVAFDFDDLIGAATAALDRDERLRGWAQSRARHLLVDEYQDTDAAQEALLHRLSPPPHDVCVVADPQQSIYAFRGAAPEAVRRFVQRWPRAGVVRLEQNYRSTKNIVAVARRLVAPYERGADTAALGLRLWTANPPGQPARLWVAPHPEREADAIAADIGARLAEGWDPAELAVLVRTHAQARPIEAALLRAKVPHLLVGGVRFFAREEIKDLLAYVRLAVLPEDSASFWRIVNTPRRGIGPAGLLTLARYIVTGTGGGPVVAARRWAATEQAPDGVYDLLAHLDELSAVERSGAGPLAVLRAALRLTAYRDHVRRQHPDDCEARLEGIADLERMAAQFESTRRFLDDAVLSSEDDTTSSDTGGRVRLSTVHSAKGLEFGAVYVAGCELGLFPLGARPGAGEPGEAPAAGDAALDPEERRIFYVAITRAKSQLTLSYCTFRRDGRTQPSPFLAEIGRGLLRRAELGSDQPRKPARRGAARSAAP